MGYAIISDIHSNLEALEAVMIDIIEYQSQSFSVDHIICLGDIVGYGPNPNECIDIVIRNHLEGVSDSYDIIKFKNVLMGNHDYAVIDEKMAKLFNSRARSVINWTRDEIMKDKEKNGRRIKFLKSLKPKYGENNYLYVHGSPSDPLGYVCSQKQRHKDAALWAIDPKIADRSFLAMKDKDVAFTGHTHYPFVLDENFNFHHAHLEPVVKLKKKGKAIIGVGSYRPAKGWR